MVAARTGRTIVTPRAEWLALLPVNSHSTAADVLTSRHGIDLLGFGFAKTAPAADGGTLGTTLPGLTLPAGG
jgi:hypothetical protein